MSSIFQRVCLFQCSQARTCSLCSRWTWPIGLIIRKKLVLSYSLWKGTQKFTEICVSSKGSESFILVSIGQLVVIFPSKFTTLLNPAMAVVPGKNNKCSKWALKDRPWAMRSQREHLSMRISHFQSTTLIFLPGDSRPVQNQSAWFYDCPCKSSYFQVSNPYASTLPYEALPKMKSFDDKSAIWSWCWISSLFPQIFRRYSFQISTLSRKNSLSMFWENIRGETCQYPWARKVF